MYSRGEYFEGDYMKLMKSTILFSFRPRSDTFKYKLKSKVRDIIPRYINNPKLFGTINYEEVSCLKPSHSNTFVMYKLPKVQRYYIPLTLPSLRIRNTVSYKLDKFFVLIVSPNNTNNFNE